jgi:hypothetical protein
MLGVIWQIASLASKLTETIRQHREDIDSLRRGLESLGRIPIVEMRLSQMESIVTKMASMIPKMDGRMAVIESKVISIREMRSPWKKEEK